MKVGAMNKESMKKPRKKYNVIDCNYDNVDDDIYDYADDKEFSENDNDTNDNDEKCNKNKNKKKLIQKTKTKTENTKQKSNIKINKSIILLN